MKLFLFWFYLVRVLVVLIGLTFVLSRWSWWALLIVPVAIWLIDQVHHALWEWDREFRHPGKYTTTKRRTTR